MRTIDERCGRWVSRDAERGAARREEERLGVGSRRLEPARKLVAERSEDDGMNLGAA